MPPKAAPEPVVKPLLGRPSNNLKMGIVGLPNVGKSTFFNAVTNSAARAENFPFCTIDPEESRVAVPDARFDWLCTEYKPKSKIPAYLTVIDIAGLVKGAASGQGLGNAFLSHIRAVDGIYHVVRAFSGEEVVHVEGEVDPTRDLEIIREELRLKDIEFLTKSVDMARKGIRGHENDKVRKFELDTLEKLLKWVEVDQREIRHGDWSPKEIEEILNPLQLLTAKSAVYLVNLSEDDYTRKKNKWLPKIKAWIDANSAGDPMIPFSGALEHALSTMGSADREKFLTEKTITSALPKIILAGYQALQLIYYFTSGADEVRAWTIRRGTKAPGAAGVIHTDFERGFIMAEVMRFIDLKELGDENSVKGAGKYHQKGREYVVEDGDIIYFKFNVGNSGKKK
jgi:obg-like ATPase 1